jgi:hypothetical protein
MDHKKRGDNPEANPLSSQLKLQLLFGLTPTGKSTSPYGKSTSSSFKFLSSEGGLCRAGGYYRLDFGFAIVSWEYRGLN